MEPMVLVSDIGIETRNLRQRVRPQRCWLMSRSAIVMLAASQGHSDTTSATVLVPSAIWRLSSARASLTRLAWLSARRCWGATVAVASMGPPRYSPDTAPGGSVVLIGLPSALDAPGARRPTRPPRPLLRQLMGDAPRPSSPAAPTSARRPEP